MTNSPADLPTTKDALVSIGLPVFNGARTLEGVVRSVLAQDHERLELVISDNASTDDTESLCRELAAADSRITYHRQPTNLGVLKNFIGAVHLAKGTFFRWIGDDDWLAPNYISRCLDVFARDDRLVLVTTQLNYLAANGATHTFEYSDDTFYSDDPIERFAKYSAYLTAGSVPIDPLYGLARRATLTKIERRNTIREDEVYATKLALAGPWGHVPEILGRRNTRSHRLAATARFLGVPSWHAQIPTIVQCAEMLRFLDKEELTALQRRRARRVVARMFVGRHWHTFIRRGRKLFGLASGDRAQSVKGNS
jgi:glycosyltransferase involved in cell wall biosynthesis